MNKRVSVYFKILLVCGCLLILFAGVLAAAIMWEGKAATTGESAEKVTYYDTEAPDVYGMFFSFPEGKSIYLNFNKDIGQTRVLLLPNNAKSSDVELAGYEIDADFMANHDFLAALIDRFEGIEFSTSADGTLNFTGVQVTAQLSKSNSVELRRDIIKALLKKIEYEGLTTADMLFLIENCETNVSYPKVYLLPETINNSLKTVSFIN